MPVATVAWVVGWTVAAAVIPGIVRNPLGEAFLGGGSAGLVFGTITGVALLTQIGAGNSILDPYPTPADSNGDAQPAR